MTATTYAGDIQAWFTVPSSITLSATTNGGGPTSVTVTAGTYMGMADFLSTLQSDLNTNRPVTGGSWTCSLSVGAGGTALVTISVDVSTFTITWTSTDLRDLLGFTATISSQTSATGTNNARGVLQLDCPEFADGLVYGSPYVTDLRQVETPVGAVYSHVGNVKRRHIGLRWQLCPNHKVWVDKESTTYESLESWLIDTQWGQGHSWFSAGSKVTLTGHTQTIGHAMNGWYCKGLRNTQDIVRRATEAWDGMWTVTFPDLVSDS